MTSTSTPEPPPCWARAVGCGHTLSARRPPRRSTATSGYASAAPGRHRPCGCRRRAAGRCSRAGSLRCSNGGAWQPASPACTPSAQTLGRARMAGSRRRRGRRHAPFRMVIVDYAEPRAPQVAAAVRACSRHGGELPVRMLLLARTAGDWWDRLQATDPHAGELLDGAPVIGLPELEPQPRPGRGLPTGCDRAGRRAAAPARPAAPGLGHHRRAAGRAWGRPVRADLGAESAVPGPAPAESRPVRPPASRRPAGRRRSG